MNFVTTVFDRILRGTPKAGWDEYGPSAGFQDRVEPYASDRSFMRKREPSTISERRPSMPDRENGDVKKSTHEGFFRHLRDQCKGHGFEAKSRPEEGALSWSRDESLGRHESGMTAAERGCGEVACDPADTSRPEHETASECEAHVAVATEAPVPDEARTEADENPENALEAEPGVGRVVTSAEAPPDTVSGSAEMLSETGAALAKPPAPAPVGGPTRPTGVVGDLSETRDFAGASRENVERAPEEERGVGRVATDFGATPKTDAGSAEASGGTEENVERAPEAELGLGRVAPDFGATPKTDAGSAPGPEGVAADSAADEPSASRTALEFSSADLVLKDEMGAEVEVPAKTVVPNGEDGLADIPQRQAEPILNDAHPEPIPEFETKDVVGDWESGMAKTDVHEMSVLADGQGSRVGAEAARRVEEPVPEGVTEADSSSAPAADRPVSMDTFSYAEFRPAMDEIPASAAGSDRGANVLAAPIRVSAADGGGPQMGDGPSVEPVSGAVSSGAEDLSDPQTGDERGEPTMERAHVPQGEWALGSDIANSAEPIRWAESVQQVSTPTTAAVSTQPNPMGLSELSEELDRIVLRTLRTGEQTLRIELHPASLGRVSVQCRETGDGLSVEIGVQMSAVRELLVGQEQDLRAALAAQGLELGQFSVTCRDQNDSSAGHSQTDRDEPERAEPVRSEAKPPVSEPVRAGRSFPWARRQWVA